jgi:hypothetical protein
VRVEEVEREAVGVRDQLRSCLLGDGLRLFAEDPVAVPVADLVLLAAPERLIVRERETKLVRVTVADGVDWRITDLLLVTDADLMALVDIEIKRARVLVGDKVDCTLVNGILIADGLGTFSEIMRIGLCVGSGERAIPAEYASGIPELCLWKSFPKQAILPVSRNAQE